MARTEKRARASRVMVRFLKLFLRLYLGRWSGMTHPKKRFVGYSKRKILKLPAFLDRPAP
jgi:hypothetical protein